MRDFLVSYNKDDEGRAKWIAWELEACEKKYSVTIQAWDFPAGCNFVVEMDKATKGCQRTIAVLSPSYLDALFTHPEWAVAFRQDPKGEKRKLIGVRVKECDVEGLLGSIVYVDAVGLDEDQARQRLLDGVSGERGKPKKKPAYHPYVALNAKPGPGSPGQPAAPAPAAPAVPAPEPAPKVFNVPYRPSSSFTGRKTLLTQLEEALEGQGSAALVQPQAIHGLGGVGKTQLALKYAWDHRDDYVVVWWLPAEEPATLASQFAGLALALGLVKRLDQDPRINIDMVRHWLESNTGWLLIFDNAPGAKEVKDYVPRSGQGHVIITSRSPLWSGLAQPLDVDKWPEPEAVDFLLRRTLRDEGQHDQALAVARELGCFPLALEQAGAYMEETGEGFTGYLEDFRDLRTRIFDQQPGYSDYEHTVATTWEANFQKVAANSPAAAQLLNLCAFLAPENIPLGIIREGKDLLPPPLSQAASHAGLNQCIARLRQFSLVGREEERLSLHRMVQMVAQDRLAEDQRRQWAAAAVALVERAFPNLYEDRSTLEACAPLLPQALAVVGHAEQVEEARGLAGRMLIQVACYLIQRADFDLAWHWLERALTWLRQAYGDGEASLARGLNLQGRIEHDRGHYPQAQEHYQAVRELLEKAEPRPQADYARVLNSLGVLAHDQGDLPGAKELTEQGLAIFENTLGPQHPDVATSLNNLASILHDRGDFYGAKGMHQRALAIWEKALGPNHPDVATSLNNLAGVLADQGALPEAKVMNERALAIWEKALGPDHPAVAASLISLAEVLRRQGDLSGARDLNERALAIWEKALGSQHPNLATSLNNLALVLHGQGDLPGAKEMHQRALAIREKALGPQHPDVANSLDSLAAVLRAQGDLLEAKKLRLRALTIQQQALGPDHPGLERMLNNMAILCQDMGNRQGERLYRARAQAIATRRKLQAQANRQAKGKAKAGKKRR